MNRKCIRSTMFAALMLFGATTINAQEIANLGELLDKGAKRLDGAEVKALLAGATVRGTTIGGQLDSETTLADDGKMSGRFWGGHPEMPPHFRGTWHVNDQGHQCFEGIADARGIGQFKGCSRWYSLNDAYYISVSDDRSAVVRMRKIKR